MLCMIAGTAALRFSTWVMRRARARRSPPSMRSTSAAGSVRRGVASGPAIGERPDSNTWPRDGPASPGRPERWGDRGGHFGAPHVDSGRPPRRALLRADEDEIGHHLDVVGDLEEQQLGDLQAVLGEGRVELRLDLEVVAREAEALL